MSTETYKQVTLARSATEGLEMRVSWIPEEFAEEGRFLKLRINGIWENGWHVVKVHGATVEGPIHVTRDIREHRRATGDAIRKRK
jgi:hypothetical protein